MFHKITIIISIVLIGFQLKMLKGAIVELYHEYKSWIKTEEELS